MQHCSYIYFSFY